MNTEPTSEAVSENGGTTSVSSAEGPRTAWVLIGPTATGKTAVANELARRMGADVLSADSMLVYTGMNIGTAKPTPAEYVGLVLHGIDLVPPDTTFSVGAWIEAARAAFASAAAHDRALIVAGGTGLYINALLRGLDAPPADAALRAQLTALHAEGGITALQAEAEARSPGSVATLADPMNPRRLIRLVERLAAAPSLTGGLNRVACQANIVAGLFVKPEVLAMRIATRIEQMFASGLLDEVVALRARYPHFSKTASLGIGYAEAMAILDGEMTQEAATARIALRTRHLAKRQRTWFRHQLDVEWVAGPADEADVPRAADEVMEVWKRHGKTIVHI